jgi:plasmid stabilization system protein ParE
MIFDVVFRRAAAAEFRDAHDWYEQRRPGLGEAFVQDVGHVILMMAENPTRFPVVSEDVRRAMARRFPYSIYFRFRDNVVVVLAVFHGRRDPNTWKRRQ